MTRHDTDQLVTDLRTMLRERVADVDAVPESVFAFERDTAPDVATVIPLQQRASRVRRTPLLLAAVVAAVLVAAGTVLAIRDGERDTDPPAGTGRPTPTTSSVPSPSRSSTPPGPDYDGRSVPVDNARVGTDAGLDYEVAEIDRRPGREIIGVVQLGGKRAEGLTGAMPYPFVVTVFEKGVFPGESVTRNWKLTTVQGTAARFGRVGLEGFGETLLPSVAFRSAGGRWALVQGRTPASATETQLARLAGQVRPDVRVPDGAFTARFGYLPSGARLTRFYSPNSGQTFDRLTIESSAATIEIVDASSVSGLGIRKGTQPRSVSGGIAYIDPDAGTAVLSPQEKSAIGVRVTAAGSGRADAGAQRELSRILSGLRVPDFGQGQPGLTFEKAFPTLR